MAAHGTANRVMHWCVPALTDQMGEVATSTAVNLNLRFIRPPDEGSEKETSTGGALCKHLCESGAKFFEECLGSAGISAPNRVISNSQNEVEGLEVSGRVAGRNVGRHDKEPYPEAPGQQQHAQSSPQRHVDALRLGEISLIGEDTGQRDDPVEGGEQCGDGEPHVVQTRPPDVLVRMGSAIDQPPARKGMYMTMAKVMAPTPKGTGRRHCPGVHRSDTYGPEWPGRW